MDIMGIYVFFELTSTGKMTLYIERDVGDIVFEYDSSSVGGWTSIILFKRVWLIGCKSWT